MFLIALALSAAAGPERWVRLGGSANAYEEYLDSESVRQSGKRATAWTRRDFAGDQVTAWHEYEFDCSARTETLLAYIRDDRGTVSHNTVRPHRKASPIKRGSVEERIFNRVCR
jgi:hypothetical protein